MERIWVMCSVFECIDGVTIAFAHTCLTLTETKNQLTFPAPVSVSSGFDLTPEDEARGREREDTAGAVSSSLLSSCFRTLRVADALVFFLNISRKKGKTILGVATVPFSSERRELFFSERDIQIMDRNSDVQSIDDSISQNLTRDTFINPTPSIIYVDDDQIKLTYPSQFLIAGIEFENKEKREGRGKEIYGGEHSSDYLRCSWKNEAKNGEGLLYNGFGELLFRGTFENDYLEGFGYIYNDGAIVLKCMYKHSILQYSTMIECTQDHIVMVEKTPEGILRYRGGFDEETMEREGYGAEYENGILSLYGLYENSMLIQTLKRFNQGVMREYDKDDNMIYIGEYRDSLDDGYPREGDGREFENGVIVFHGHYHNGQREGPGTEFYPYGVARLKGVWSAGECVEEHELDRLGYYTHVKNDGRSTNCVRIVNGVETVSTRLRDIRISDGVGNSEMLKSFVLDSAKQVVSVVVGDGCFTNVTKVSLCGLPLLTSVKIGCDSFTHYDRGDQLPSTPVARAHCLRVHASLVVRDCPRLTELTAEMGSFSSFCVLDLKRAPAYHHSPLDLPALQDLRFGTATIGPVGTEAKSFCFFYATELILTDLPALEAVEIGCSAFTSLSTLSVSSTAACVPSRVDLPNLLTFTAGYGSCYGGCKHGMGQLNVYFGSRRADGV